MAYPPRWCRGGAMERQDLRPRAELAAVVCGPPRTACRYGRCGGRFRGLPVHSRRSSAPPSGVTRKLSTSGQKASD